MMADQDNFDFEPLDFDAPLIPGADPDAEPDGATYEREFDYERLTGQLLRIYELMKDREWRTLREISSITGDPPASVSADLRHFRKEKWGSHTVNRRARGERRNGLYEYQLIPHDNESEAPHETNA